MNEQIKMVENTHLPLNCREVYCGACKDAINLLKSGSVEPAIQEDLDTLMDLINNYPEDPFPEETDCIIQLILQLSTYFYQKGCLMYMLKLRDIKNCVTSRTELDKLLEERKKENDKN